MKPLTLFAAMALVLGIAACGDERGFPCFRGTCRGGGIDDRKGDDPESGSSGDSSSTGPSGATTTTATTGAGSGGTDTSAAQICVDRINQYRSTVGQPPLGRWTAQESCADGQSESDSQSGAAHGAFTQCGEWAQNECPGWPGPAGSMIGECLDAMWGEGPGGGHYENMRSSEYTQVACGFHVTPSGDVWAVQDFTQ